MKTESVGRWSFQNMDSIIKTPPFFHTRWSLPSHGGYRADYQEKRANGCEKDSPPRLFPWDGITSDWIKDSVLEGYYNITYTQGPEDKRWMEERDRNYVLRLEEEGKLDTEEPKLKDEVPALYAEVVTLRERLRLV